MNIIPVPFKILRVTNAVIRESSLPNLPVPIEVDTHSVRIASLNELHRTLQGDVHGGR